MSPRKSTPPPERIKLKNVALFRDEETEKVTDTTSQIPLERIVIAPSQPRRYFDRDQLERLTLSVKEHGILEPLLVRPLKDGRYELIAGERRYRAATAAALTSVPVVIKDLDDKQALQLALIENLQREDLNPVEETEGVLQLLALQLDLNAIVVRQLLYQMKNAVEKSKKETLNSRDNVIPNSQTEAENTISSLFESLGQNWYSFTCNRLPLLNLPEEILEALRQGQIEYTKAKAIARIKDEESRKQLLEAAIAKSLSLSKIRELIKDLRPIKQQSDLKSRFDLTYKKAKKAKKLWHDSKKQKQLESLLTKLEKLIEEENI